MARGKDNSAPDFSEFDDWRMRGTDEENLYDWEGKSVADRGLIVKRNMELLLNRGAWTKKVSAFEVELNKIADEEEREIKRQEFEIHFDHYRPPHNKRDIFHGKLDFSEYHFPCITSFAGVIFSDQSNSDKISFQNAYFDKGNISFERTAFGNRKVIFTKTNFGDSNVKFKNTFFGNSEVNFDGTTFGSGEVNFTDAIFGHREVQFEEELFGDKNVTFEKATFGLGSLFFDGAQFGKGHVWFTGAKFKGGYVSFSRAKFKGEFNFKSNKKESKLQSASFNDIIVSGNLTINADFHEVATFQRLDVKGSANFSGSSFKKVPDFRDMKLDRPPEVAGMEVPPEKLKMGFWPFAKYSGDKGDVAKYRKLKSMAIAASDHVKSGKFFSYEMMAKRGIETTGRFALLFNWLYGLLGGYGQSYGRPMIALFGLWLLTAIFNIWKIFQELVFVSEWDWWQNIALSFLLSAKNLTPIFNSLSRFVPSPSGYESWFQDSMNRLKTENVNIDWLTSIGILEQFIGTIFLFLLLLGLRNAFRLK